MNATPPPRTWPKKRKPIKNADGLLSNALTCRWCGARRWWSRWRKATHSFGDFHPVCAKCEASAEGSWVYETRQE